MTECPQFTKASQMADFAPRPPSGAWARYRYVFAWKNTDGSYFLAKCYPPRVTPKGIKTGRWVSVPDIISDELTDLEKAGIRDLLPDIAKPRAVQTSLV